MKRNILAAAIVISMLAFTGCSSKTAEAAETTAAQTETAAAETENDTEAAAETEVSDEEETEQVIGMPNPWSDHKDMAEAAAAAGFELEIPEEIAGTKADSFRTLDGTDATLEVIFHDGKGEETARIRKAPGSDDISGDYNDYKESKDVEIGDISVNMKGNNGKIMLATWQDGDYTYAVSASADGLSEADMTAVAEAVK